MTAKDVRPAACSNANRQMNHEQNPGTRRGFAVAAGVPTHSSGYASSPTAVQTGYATARCLRYPTRPHQAQVRPLPRPTTPTRQNATKPYCSWAFCRWHVRGASSRRQMRSETPEPWPCAPPRVWKARMTSGKPDPVAAVVGHRARVADVVASARAQETKTAKESSFGHDAVEAEATARGGRVQQTKAQQEHPHQDRRPCLLVLIEVEAEAAAGVEEAVEAVARAGCARRRLGLGVVQRRFSRREVF